MRDPSTIREGAIAALLPRGAAFSLVVLGHLFVLVGFLAQMRIGLPVALRPDSHPTDAETPMIATVIWEGTQGKE